MTPEELSEYNRSVAQIPLRIVPPAVLGAFGGYQLGAEGQKALLRKLLAKGKDIKGAPAALSSALPIGGTLLGLTGGASLGEHFAREPLKKSRSLMNRVGRRRNEAWRNRDQTKEANWLKEIGRWAQKVHGVPYAERQAMETMLKNQKTLPLPKFKTHAEQFAERAATQPAKGIATKTKPTQAMPSMAQARPDLHVQFSKQHGMPAQGNEQVLDYLMSAPFGKLGMFYQSGKTAALRQLGLS